MTEQALLTINSWSVGYELSGRTWESPGTMKHKKQDNPSLNPHEEKILHLRGQLEVDDDDCALELASGDPMVMQRLLAIEANIIAAARARRVHDDSDEC